MQYHNPTSVVYSKFLLPALAWFLSVNAFCRDVRLIGRVADQLTGTPIGYANISLQGVAYGCITNPEGEFRLTIPEKHVHRRVIVSFIGYAPVTIFPAQFTVYQAIQLKPVDLVLPEVIVKQVDPLNILRKAIMRIPDNYPIRSQILNAYYREMVKVDTAFVKYADAACLIKYHGYSEEFDPSLASSVFYAPEYDYLNKAPLPLPMALHSLPHQLDSVKFFEIRRSTNLENFSSRWGFEESMRKFNIGGGPTRILAGDIIKLRGDFVDSTFWKYYTFQFKGTTTLNGRDVYIIAFSPRKLNNKAILDGLVYIDKASMAFVLVEMEVSDLYVKFLRTASVEQEVDIDKRKIRKQTRLTSVTRTTVQSGHKLRLAFAEMDSVWYLNQITMDNSFINYGDLFDTIRYFTYTDLFVNAIDFESHFSALPGIVSRPNVYFYLFEQSVQYNPDFWKSYNKPQPSGLFRQAMKDIERTTSLEQQFIDQSLQK